MDYIFLLSRLILALYFLFNGINNLIKINVLVEYLKTKKIPQPKLMILISSLLLIIGGITILLGIYVEIGILALTLFFLPVTFIMHNFWKIQEPEIRMIETVNFMKNIVIWAGTLLLLFVPQPWICSLSWGI